MFQYLNRFIILLGMLYLSCSGGTDSKQIYTGVIEGTMVKVPALTGGKIMHLLIDNGYSIEKGEVMAQIDTLDLSFQKQNLDGLLHEVDNQQQIARTQVKRAGKELRYVQEKYQRFEELLKNESISQQSVDDLKNQLQNAESVYQTAQQQLRQAEAKRIQVEAQLKSIQKRIQDATIISPLTGIVADKFYEEGEAVPPLAPLAEIIQLDLVWVKIYVSEKMLPHIQTGQQVKIHIDGSDQILSGTIGWINSKAEFTPKSILTPETRTSLVYAVKIDIANPDHLLKQGMPVEVHLK